MEWKFLIFYVFVCIAAAIYQEYLIATRKPFESKVANNQFKDFLYVLDTIRSCSTFQELNTAGDWIARLEYSLEPSAREILTAELNKKMLELENEMNVQSGGAPKKVQ